MDNVPVEVYSRIFHYLSRPEIRICCFVCKKWNDAAAQVYNKVLIIDDYKVQLAKSNLANATNDAYFKNGHLVQKLTLKSRYKDVSGRKNRKRFSLSRAEFLLLLKYLPNIEEINLFESGNFTEYISFLIDADLQKIKEITCLPFEYSFGTNVYNQYILNCFRFCDTLTSLYFRYKEAKNNYYFRGMDILNMLRRFKNLKQLVFHNMYCNNSIVFQVPELCSQLTELTFKGEYTDSDTVIQDLSDLKIAPTVKLNKSLRHLNITLKSLSIDFTKCLTSYIEDDSLTTINIYAASTTLYYWIEKVGMESALKLIKKLGPLNNVRISFSHPRRILPNELEMTKWLQTAKAFTENKRVPLTVKLSDSNLSQDYFECSLSDGGLIYGSNGPFALSFINSISSTSKIIDRLELNLGNLELFLSEHLRLWTFLKYTFIKCLHLQYQGCYFQIRGYPNRENGELSGAQNNLNIVYFFDEMSFYLLSNVVFTYLPNVEVLVLGNQSRNNSSWYIAELKRLKPCHIIIQEISDYNRGPLTIKSECINGKGKLYSYDKDGLIEKKEQDQYSRPDFTFMCERDIDFVIHSELNEGLFGFDFDKPSQNRSYSYESYKSKQYKK